MKWALLLVLSLSQIIVFAQTPSLEWSKKYGVAWVQDIPVHIDTDQQGYVYFGGTIDEGHGNNSLRIAKYNSSGTLIWSRFYTPDFPYFTTWMRAMDVDSAGNVCILASVAHDNGFDVMVLQKYNSAGTKLWTIKEELPEMDIHLRAMVVDKAGNIYAGGFVQYGSYTSNPTSDFIVFKYNKNGNKTWGNMYNGSAGGLDAISDIAVDATGNVYVTGSTEQEDAQFPIIKHKRTTIIKYSGLGYFQWQKHHWYSGANDNHPQTLKVDASGNLYLAVLYSFSSDFNASLMKYNTNGTPLWTRSVPGLKYPKLLMTMDAMGNSYLTSVVQGAGTRNLNFSMYKYSSAGTQLWNSRYDGGDSTQDIPSDIAVDRTGSVYITGGSYFTKPAPLTYERKPKAITIKYNSVGDESWVAKYEGAGTDTLSTGVCLALHGTGFEPVIYVAGNSVKVTTGFDPFYDDMLLLKYNQSRERSLNSTLEPIVSANPVSLYNLGAAPNPFRGSTVIRFDLPYDAQVSLKIYDVLGREVRTLIYGSRKAGAHLAIFNAGNLIPQQYFFTLTLTSAVGEFRETKPLLLRK